VERDENASEIEAKEMVHERLGGNYDMESILQANRPSCRPTMSEVVGKIREAMVPENGDW
jgi:hypothetical protein